MGEVLFFAKVIMIEYRTGDIFKANVEALVNPVNCVGVMGAGLASQFKAAFPKNFYAYAKACKQGQVQLGKMFIYRNQTELNPQYIINFPTKNHWLSESRFQDIVAGLEALKLVLQEYYISSVAIPALGCGLGGLEWSEGFQFIGFPSEWGVCSFGGFVMSKNIVSNLLGFPASGECHSGSALVTTRISSFQFIGFPSEWGA